MAWYGMSDDLNEWRSACLIAEARVEELEKEKEYWQTKAMAVSK